MTLRSLLSRAKWGERSSEVFEVNFGGGENEEKSGGCGVHSCSFVVYLRDRQFCAERDRFHSRNRRRSCGRRRAERGRQSDERGAEHRRAIGHNRRTRTILRSTAARGPVYGHCG